MGAGLLGSLSVDQPIQTQPISAELLVQQPLQLLQLTLAGKLNSH